MLGRCLAVLLCRLLKSGDIDDIPTATGLVVYSHLHRSLRAFEAPHSLRHGKLPKEGLGHLA